MTRAAASRRSVIPAFCTYIFCRSPQHRQNSPCSLLNLDFDRLRFGVASRVLNGERVGRGPRGCDIHAAGVGRPHGMGLRLKLDGFGVGHSVAELDRFTAVHSAGTGVEALNVELFAAELVERRTIVFSSLFTFCLRILPIDLLM